MNLKLLASVVLIISFNAVALATPQLPDILIYEGKEYPVYGEFLEPFFERNPNRRPKFCGGMSSLWRGYVAYIELVKDELVLADIRIHTVNPADPLCLKESKVSEVAPDGKPFKFGWFSGDLLAAYGEHVGGENFYDVEKVWEKYSLFKIDKGKLQSVRHFSNAEYQKYLEQLPTKSTP